MQVRKIVQRLREALRSARKVSMDGVAFQLELFFKQRGQHHRTDTVFLETPDVFERIAQWRGGCDDGRTQRETQVSRRKINHFVSPSGEVSLTEATSSGCTRLGVSDVAARLE